jgi:hypothetical protein
MNAQIPKIYHEEGMALFHQYMKLPDGTPWDDFLHKNASKEYLHFIKERDDRLDRLFREQGIIEN